MTGSFINNYYTQLNGFGTLHENHISILLYHGVTRVQSDGIENFSKKHITSDEFASDLDYLKKYCSVLSMDELVDFHQRKNSPPKNTVVITFDDGFANNHEVAAPILDDFSLPATFYISAGMIGTTELFWVDQIEDCLNKTEVPKVTLRWGEKDNVFSIGDQTSRINAVSSIKDYCKSAPASQKDAVINALIEQTKVEPTLGETENYRIMNWEQVCSLDNHHLFTIGGHSMYHNILGNLSEADAKAEIEGSISLIKQKTGTDQRHYAYPEGQPHHYTEHTIKILKNNGIICCPSAFPGVNSVSDNLFHLRRIIVRMFSLPFPFTDRRLTT